MPPLACSTNDNDMHRTHMRLPPTVPFRHMSNQAATTTTVSQRQHQQHQRRADITGLAQRQHVIALQSLANTNSNGRTRLSKWKRAGITSSWTRTITRQRLEQIIQQALDLLDDDDDDMGFQEAAGR